MAHLHSVRLRGFKTFARPTELLFEPGVTVVIGPNGSGKSNIADAVLWVLGEQSPGNLRGRTMQDVIFTGPDGRRSSAVAEVSLVFDNECGSLPLDCSQVQVTRRLVRESGSEYRLNGSVCRLLDVQDLFGGLGMGREMHSVVSQGKVEAVLSSTPEARRALVEEAAGLGRFKKRRERTRAKLERTRQNLLRVADVEREVKSALRPLRQQVAAAERFAQAMEEWALAKGRALLSGLTEVERLCGETEEALAALRLRRAEVEDRLAAIRRRRAADEERFTFALQEREDLSGLFHRVQAEAERLEARAMALRQRVARNEAELDRAARRRELAASLLVSLSDRVEKTAAHTSDEGRLEVVSTILEQKQAELEAVLPAFRTAAADEDDLKDDIFELETVRSRASQDRDLLRRQMEDKDRISTEVSALSAAATAREGELQAQEEELARRCEEADASLTQSIEAVTAAEERRDDTRARTAAAEQEERHLGELLSGLASRRTVLRDLIVRREGLSNGARGLLEAGEGSRLLTEVLVVEPGYERALAAALGPLIQAVVLEDGCDVATALRLEGPVEVLWERENARAARENGAGSPPAGLRDLWEVVSGPRAVVDGLRSLVPPTALLIEEDGSAAAALRSSTEGWRLVTRTGELITGSVHAARRTEAGAEAHLRARNELEAVEDEHQRVEAQRGEAVATTVRARVALREAEAAHQGAEEDLRSAERASLNSRNEADLLVRRVEEARRHLQELKAREERERVLRAQLTLEAEEVEVTLKRRDAELQEVRAALCSLQADLEASRRQVGLLEEKKAQAVLLAVRLRERCRAQEAERERARAQRDAAAADAERFGRRVEMLAAYGPVLAGLLSCVERLTDRTRGAAGDLELRVGEARSQSDGAAQVMREGGGEESTLQREHDALATQIADLQVDHARLDDRRALLDAELAELRRKHLSPRNLAPKDVAGESAESLERAVERADQRRERIGPVNPLAEQECAEMEERARFLGEQRRDLEASMAQLQDVISGLDEHVNTAFMEIFSATKDHFEAVIATIFPGAKGSLALTEAGVGARRDKQADGESPDEGGEDEDIIPGISLSVKLPNKAPRSMSLLSGGEKAMTAIAFLFSLFLARPCPFYILDEVEASLDDVNIRRFLSLIHRYRDRTQFIIITHQRQTMEIADTLYGVALEADGTSRVLSRRLGSSKRAARDEEQQRAPMMVKEA